MLGIVLLQSIIVKCTSQYNIAFTHIMTEAFDDKYPLFFKGIEKKRYIPILEDMNAKKYSLKKSPGIYIILFDNQVAGAIEFYVGKESSSFFQDLKILVKHLGFIRGIKISFMLLGFGPPVIFPKKTLFIDKIGIHKDFRRKGLGEKLMKFTINFARELNYEKCVLEVISTNKGAIALYQKLGFKIARTITTKLGEVFMGVSKYHIMIKSLNE